MKKTGKFSKQESNVLTNYVKIYGAENWCSIAKLLPGRTSHAWSQHWHRVCKPKINFSQWTQSEDEIIEKLIFQDESTAIQKLKHILQKRSEIDILDQTTIIWMTRRFWHMRSTRLPQQSWEDNYWVISLTLQSWIQVIQLSLQKVKLFLNPKNLLKSGDNEAKNSPE